MTTHTVEYNATVKNERTTETDTIMGESSKHDREQMHVTENYRWCNINSIKPISKHNTVFAYRHIHLIAVSTKGNVR